MTLSVYKASMGYEEQEYNVVGRVPEFGAIFVSNIATKKECFRRKIFGLPSSQANFVKHVKAGMLLFLFEYERRELFGVYQAKFDGAMNILPHAFSSSGIRFPAQVQFTPIWYCSPLTEIEFRDAIRENYFSAKKFNFGLSEVQVRRLLLLFSSRKLRYKLPQRPFTKITYPVGEDRLVVDDDRYAMSENFEIETGDDGFGPVTSGKYPRNSLDRVKRMNDGRLPTGNWLANEHKMDSLGWDFLTDRTADSLDKRIENDDRFLTVDATDNERYDGHSDHTIWTEHLGNSVCKGRRIADEDQFLLDDTEENKHYLNSIPGHYCGRVERVANDGRLLMKYRLGNEHNMDNGFGSVIPINPPGNSLARVRRTTDNGQFFMNNLGENEHNIVNSKGPSISTHHAGDLPGKVRRAAEDSQFFMNGDRLQNNHDLVDGAGRVISTKHFGTLLGGARRPRDDDGLLMSERTETRHGLDIGLEPVKLSKHFGDPLWTDGWSVDGRLSAGDEIVNEHNLYKNHGLAISSGHSGYALGEDRTIIDDDRFRKSERVETRRDINNCTTPCFQSNQNPFFYSSKSIVETEYSFLQNQRRHPSALSSMTKPESFGLAYPTSHDAIVTRAAPYDPELPNIHHGSSSSFEINNSSNSGKDCLSYRGSEDNLLSLSKSRSSLHHLQPKGLSTSLDAASEFENNVRFPLTSDDCRTNSSFSNAIYPEKLNFNTPAAEVFRGSLFSDHSLASPSFPKSETHEIKNMTPSYALSLSKNPSSASGDGFHLSKYGHVILRHESDESFPEKDVLPSDSKWHLLKDATSHEYYQSSEVTNLDSKTKRTSVFARLSSGPKARVQEQDNNTHIVLDDYLMDASADEIMNILHLNQNHQVQKLRKDKPSDKHVDDGTCRNKKQTKVDDQTEHYQPTITSVKMNLSGHLAAEDHGDQILKETRVVDFRRRSEIKKTMNETSTKGFVEIPQDKTSGESAEGEGLEVKQLKRRRLVRPAFDNRGLADVGMCCKSSLKLQLPPQESSLSMVNRRISEDSIKCCENNDTSHNDGLIHGHEGNDNLADRNANSEGKRNSEKSELSRSHESEGGKEWFKNGVPKGVSTLSFKNVARDNGASHAIDEDCSTQDLANIGFNSSGQEQPPDLCRTEPDPGNCTGSEQTMVQDVEKVKETVKETKA